MCFNIKESFHCFLTDLKLKARSCTFNELGDSMICDQILEPTTRKWSKSCYGAWHSRWVIQRECARLGSWQRSMRRPRHHTWSSLSRGEAVDAISVEGKHPVQIQAQLEPSRYNLMMDKCLGGTALLWIHGCLWSIRSYLVFWGTSRFYKAAFYMTNADI